MFGWSLVGYVQGCISGMGKIKNEKMALPGIEPGLARPQRDVIPLDHSTFVEVFLVQKDIS
jgi:hypothetical protein